MPRRHRRALADDYPLPSLRPPAWSAILLRWSPVAVFFIPWLALLLSGGNLMEWFVGLGRPEWIGVAGYIAFFALSAAAFGAGRLVDPLDVRPSAGLRKTAQVYMFLLLLIAVVIVAAWASARVQGITFIALIPGATRG